MIAATNKDLTELVSGGAFRTDLLYRLNAITIQISSLQERRSDTAIAEWARPSRSSKSAAAHYTTRSLTTKSWSDLTRRKTFPVSTFPNNLPGSELSRHPRPVSGIWTRKRALQFPATTCSSLCNVLVHSLLQTLSSSIIPSGTLLAI